MQKLTAHYYNGKRENEKLKKIFSINHTITCGHIFHVHEVPYADSCRHSNWEIENRVKVHIMRQLLLHTYGYE